MQASVHEFAKECVVAAAEIITLPWIQRRTPKKVGSLGSSDRAVGLQSGVG